MFHEGDENVMSFSSHENQMVVRGSPHPLKQKSDRLSLFDLVEDVENARDQLKTISEEVKFARRSIGTRGPEKRNYGNRSPRTPLGDTSFRTSNQKRQSTKGTPSSLSFFDSASPKSPSRRMTVDPADLAAMMRELEEEAANDDESSISQLNSSLRCTEMRDSLLNNSPMSEMSTFSRGCVSKIPNMDTSHCSQKSSNTAVSTASEAFERLESDRRATCDPADILQMMREFQDESGDSNGMNRCDRRMTADPEDMAEIMRGLEEEDKIARDKNNLHDSICGSDYDELSDIGNGRESMCTVDLVRSVADMLKDLEGSNQISSQDKSDVLSTVSSFSIKSNSSSKNKNNQKAYISPSAIISTTVAATNATIFNTKMKKTAGMEISQMNISLSSSSIATDSDETVGTMDLIANIQNMISNNENENENKNGDNKSYEDNDNTMMTVSSFGSIGGLLNMVADEVEHSSQIHPITVETKVLLQGPSPGLSPRRSRRISGEKPTVEDNLQSDLLLEPELSMNCTPSKSGPFSSSCDGLRSCLTKNMKQITSFITTSPVVSARKSVVFGSPKVAEFYKTLPATNMTPMRREIVRKMFSMQQKDNNEEEEEEEEKEKGEVDNNSNIIDNSDEWDRLTNTSGGSPEQSDGEQSSFSSPLPLPIPGSPAFNKRYYTPDELDISPVRPPLIADATSILRRSPRRSSNISKRFSVDSTISNISNEEVSGTVMLPNSLAELLNQVTTTSNSSSKLNDNKQMKSNNLLKLSDIRSQSPISILKDDCTEELEIDLHSLIHRHHEINILPSLDIDKENEINELEGSMSLSSRNNDSSIYQYSKSSSVPSLGPLLGLSHSGSIEMLSYKNTTDGDLSMSSPMSSVRTNESVVTINEKSSSMIRLDLPTTKNTDLNLDSKVDSDLDLDNSVISMCDGVTVELEVGLQDMMKELNSMKNSKKKSKKMKKRLSLRVKSIPISTSIRTPILKSSDNDISSPWIGDMSIISTIDDDRTAKLENNLVDLMVGVSSSNTGSLPSSPIKFSSEGSPRSFYGATEVVEVEVNNIQEYLAENQLNDVGILENVERERQIDEERSIDISTASTKSSNSAINLRNDSELIMTKQSDKFNNVLTTVRSSDIDYFNLVQGGETYSSYADMSICSAVDHSMDVSILKSSRQSSVAGNAMMQRLHALNAGARLNSLDQCGTPLAATKGSMSIGMKRHSLSINHHLARSVTKMSRASISSGFGSRHVQYGGVKGISQPLVPMGGAVVCSTPLKHDILLTASTPSAIEINNDISNVPESVAKMQKKFPSPINTPLPVPVQVPVFVTVDLLTIFSAVALDTPFDTTESSSLVLQATNIIQNDEEYCTEVRTTVNNIMIDILKVANKEARVEAETIEDMEKLWFDVKPDSDVMKLARTLIEKDEDDTTICSDKIFNMKDMARECKEMSAINWSKFEDKLLAVATTAIEEKNIDVLKKIAEKKQLNTDNNIRNKQNNIISVTKLEGRMKLKALQNILKNTRNNLDESANELRSLQENVSNNLEFKKDFMIAMIVEKEKNEKELQMIINKEKSDLELIEKRTAHELLTAKKELSNIKQNLGLLNRLTYCRVLTYQSNCIEIEAVLSTKLRVQILFYLSLDKRANKLIVDGAHVDLKYIDPSGLSGKTITFDPNNRENWDSDTMLANAYFLDVLCSDDVSGPLSEEVLSKVTHPSDIPSIMQKISGFISSFRRSSTWLDCFNLGGWTWNVDGVNVRILDPKKEFVFTLAVRTIMSGDVRAVQTNAIRRTIDNSIAFDKELNIAINTIKLRCTSPFGSFPSGQIKQAIERFLIN